MRFNFGKEDDLKFMLVLGYAGSGKTHRCGEIASNDVMINHHDEWVAEMYKVDQDTKDYISVLIPDAMCDNQVIKHVILETIMADDVIASLLASYWKSMYTDMIRNTIRLILDSKSYEMVQVFEIPYYDEEINDLVMEYHPYFAIDVVDTPRSICYDRLKEIRNWSEERIAMTLRMQDRMYRYMKRVLPFCNHTPVVYRYDDNAVGPYRTCRRCGMVYNNGHFTK